MKKTILIGLSFLLITPQTQTSIASKLMVRVLAPKLTTYQTLTKLNVGTEQERRFLQKCSNKKFVQDMVSYAYRVGDISDSSSSYNKLFAYEHLYKYFVDYINVEIDTKILKEYFAPIINNENLSFIEKLSMFYEASESIEELEIKTKLAMILSAMVNGLATFYCFNAF